MLVEVVDDPAGLGPLQQAWDDVYAADPEAQFFLSWTWVSRTIHRKRGWFVLVARPGPAEPPVAFFPLRLKRDEIVVAGRGAADYNGFLCDPTAEDAALAAFAAHLKAQRWARLRLDYVCASERRLTAFLRHFPRDAFRTKDAAERNEDGVDNCICPLARLPDDWDAWLGQISANTRQKIRRYLRKVEGSTELRITVADASTVERDVDGLLRLWSARWADRKGERLDGIVGQARANLLSAFEGGALFLPVLWSGGTPVGALATLVDPHKKAFLFKLAARDPACEQPPPGLVLHAYSIRHAIGRGFRTYEFLRGNEPYKYSFSDGERRLRKLVVSPRR